ncbi:hypothetical protein HDU93_000244 [Gonapodya sp. JEL0774]|nr:hypothetical protein HDU93_000244 [Gonapodya sp. JEL0774]
MSNLPSSGIASEHSEVDEGWGLDSEPADGDVNISDTLLKIGSSGLLKRALEVGQEREGQAVTTAGTTGGNGLAPAEGHDIGSDGEPDHLEGNQGGHFTRSSPQVGRNDKPANVSLAEDVWLSVLTPGIPNQRVQAVFHVVFFCMMVSLLGLWWAADWSLHVLVLVVAGGGLWGSTTWGVYGVSEFCNNGSE